MATSLTQAYRSRGLKVTGWLLFVAIFGALTVAVWIASTVKPAASHKKTATEAPAIADPLIKLSTINPNEMATAVKPITFDAVVRDMRNYPPQFTDSRYLKANAGKWVIQIMNVAEHEVVTDYLNGREDKDNFKYFRIVDENNQKRYVVTYGLYGTPQEAMTASKSSDFGLPSNVTAFPEEMRSYLEQVDEYEINTPVSDLGSKAPKEVKLRSTPKVIPAPVAKDKPKTDTTSKSNDSTSDTKNTTATPDKPNEQTTTPVAKPATPKTTTNPVPTRPAPRGETLVIQDKPVPAFVEKPKTSKNDATPDKKPANNTNDNANRPKKPDSVPTRPDRMSDLIREKNQ